MTLKEWLADQERRGEVGVIERLAAQVGEPTALVRSWVSGRVVPSHHQKILLVPATYGAVRPGDWK